MNITFLVGNGFDLGCGLKSKYKDAYPIYKKINNTNDSECVKRFRAELNDCDETWNDFEMGMANNIMSFNSEQDFIDCVRDFSIFLNRYILEQQDTFWLRYDKSHKNWREAILEHLAESFFLFYSGNSKNTFNTINTMLSSSKTLNFNFINFNYTNIFEELLKKAINFNAVKGKILPVNPNLNIELDKTIHIHGKLGEDWVLGVDNLTQFNKIPFSITDNFKNCFIKPFFNNTFDKSRVLEADGLIKQSDIICIVGMSLGDSDLTWKNKIIDWLLQSEEHHIFYYDFDAMSQENIAPFDKIRLEDRAKLNLIKILGANSDNLFGQVHIPVGKWMFNIDKVQYTITYGAKTANPVLILK